MIRIVLADDHQILLDGLRRLIDAKGDMQVVATRRTVNAGDTDPDCDTLLPLADLDQLLAASDYVVLSMPLTAETRGMIGATQFERMKQSAFLLNVARGDVVDQHALVQALKANRIAGAALDVASPEPLPPDSELWSLPNLVLTPHMAGNVEGYGHKATEAFIRNLRRYCAGEPLEHLANPDLGY